MILRLNSKKRQGDPLGQTDFLFQKERAMESEERERGREGDRKRGREGEGRKGVERQFEQ